MSVYARVHLLGGPYVTFGDKRVEIPDGGKRLLAFLALQRKRQGRRFVAGTFWPGVGEARAAGNLRSTLWRLRSAGIDLIDADKWGLALRSAVLVDLTEVDTWVSRVTGGGAHPEDLGLPVWWSEALALLPGWYEDWTCAERDRLRHQVLHALEVVAGRLVAAGRAAAAIEVAMAVCSSEPLRETAQRVLIKAHQAQGNVAEARRCYLVYRDLLRLELGVEPGADLGPIAWSGSEVA